MLQIGPKGTFLFNYIPHSFSGLTWVTIVLSYFYCLFESVFLDIWMFRILINTPTEKFYSIRHQNELKIMGYQ